MDFSIDYCAGKTNQHTIIKFQFNWQLDTRVLIRNTVKIAIFLSLLHEIGDGDGHEIK